MAFEQYQFNIRPNDQGQAYSSDLKSETKEGWTRWYYYGNDVNPVTNKKEKVYTGQVQLGLGYKQTDINSFLASGQSLASGGGVKELGISMSAEKDINRQYQPAEYAKLKAQFENRIAYIQQKKAHPGILMTRGEK